MPEVPVQAGTGRVAPATPRAIARIRATSNVTALVGAVLFLILLVLSWDRPAVVWYVARVGLITITALAVSFIAIIIENRLGQGDSLASAVRTVALLTGALLLLIFLVTLALSVRDPMLRPAAIGTGLATFLALVVANVAAATENRRNRGGDAPR